MTDLHDLFRHAAGLAADHRADSERPVHPTALGVLDGPNIAAIRDALGRMRDQPTPPRDVVDELVAAVEPALVATTGSRYFGFVIGGALASATAADIVTAGWDQNAYSALSSQAPQPGRRSSSSRQAT